VSLTIAKQYIGAYTEPAHKNPDIRIWREKSSRKSGFAKVERICKHYALPAWGPLLNVELVHNIDGILKRSFR